MRDDTSTVQSAVRGHGGEEARGAAPVAPLAPLRPAAAALVFVLLALAFLLGLGAWPLIEPDEGRNAEVGREMLALGRWIVPHFDYLPYLDKPVLLFWAIAAGFRAFGVGELAARLPSALSAIGTIALTWVLGWRLLGPRSGLAAAVVFATAPLVLAFGRLVIFDMPLTALVTATLCCLVEARLGGGAWRWWPAAGALMGLATLTKGPVGLVLPLVAWAAARSALPAAPRRTGIGPVLVAVAACGAIVLPWLVLAELDQPGFLRYAIVDETFLRLVSPDRFDRSGPPWYYLAMLTWVLGAWGVVLAATAPVLARRRPAGGEEVRGVAFAARAAGAILVFFTLSASKRPGYVLPAMVPLALLVAAGIDAAPRRLMATVRTMGLAACMLGVAAFAAGLAGVSLRAERVDAITPALLERAGVVFVAWGIATFGAGGRRLWTAILACAVIGPGLGLALWPSLAAYAESRSARAIAEHVAPGARVICFRTFRAGLPFYLRRPVLLASDSARELTSNYVIARRDRLRDVGDIVVPEAALADVLCESRPTYVLTSQAGEARLRKISPCRLSRAYVQGRFILLRTDDEPGAGGVRHSVRIATSSERSPVVTSIVSTFPVPAA